MDLRNRYQRIAKVTLCASTLLTSFTPLIGVEEKEPDPWFTEKRVRPEPQTDDDETTVVLKRTNPASLVRQMKKELAIMPEGNLNQRIRLLEDIVSTAQPDPDDQELLASLREIRADAITAIASASDPAADLEASIKSLGEFSKYFRSDTSLLVALLDSNFSKRLTDRVSSLGRNNQIDALAAIRTQIEQANLNSVFGSQLRITISGASNDMIARRWDQLTQGTTPLPGEAYLLGQLLNQPDKKLRLAIELPQDVDPGFAKSITRSLESGWGRDFQIVRPEQRKAEPEFVVQIGANRIQSSHTTSEKQITSQIPGAVIEEPNPDFLDLVARYEKAAESYEVALRSYDSLYKQYMDDMNDSEYRQAQNDMKLAEANLKATPPPQGPGGSPEFEAATAQFQAAQAMANSITAPAAIAPQEPTPHHLEILDELYLIPSTIVISSENTPYEYTKQDLTFEFETQAPIKLVSPASSEVEADSTVTLSQDRKWTQTVGTDPRDPTVDDGTYSETEYQSALDLFGLEFGEKCNRELSVLFEEAKTDLQQTAQREQAISQTLLLVALKSATSETRSLSLSESELDELAKLAQTTNISPRDFRAACLAKILGKTEFAHLADKDRIAQLL